MQKFQEVTRHQWTQPLKLEGLCRFWRSKSAGLPGGGLELLVFPKLCSKDTSLQLWVSNLALFSAPPSNQWIWQSSSAKTVLKQVIQQKNCLLKLSLHRLSDQNRLVNIVLFTRKIPIRQFQCYKNQWMNESEIDFREKKATRQCFGLIHWLWGSGSFVQHLFHVELRNGLQELTAFAES